MKVCGPVKLYLFQLQRCSPQGGIQKFIEKGKRENDFLQISRDSGGEDLFLGD